jgi:hypothetical protein
MESGSYEQRAEEASDGTFPSFFRGDVRGERMFADGAADEVGGGVRGPGDSESKEEEGGAVLRKTMDTDGKGKRESDEKKRAGGDACGGKGLNEWAASEESEDGKAENEQKKEGDGGDQPRSWVGVDSGECNRSKVGGNDQPAVGRPDVSLLRNEQKRAEDSPEVVGAVTDGITKSEIFAEGKDGDESESDGNGPRGSEEDDGDDDGDEDECGENASAGHSREARIADWRERRESALAGGGGGGVDGAIAAFALLEIEEGFQEACAVEIGPERFGDENFSVCDLPEKEIADAHFAGGANEEVRVG